MYHIFNYDAIYKGGFFIKSSFFKVVGVFVVIDILG
jgi:hypothetical protein